MVPFDSSHPTGPGHVTVLPSHSLSRSRSHSSPSSSPTSSQSSASLWDCLLSSDSRRSSAWYYGGERRKSDGSMSSWDSGVDIKSEGEQSRKEAPRTSVQLSHEAVGAIAMSASGSFDSVASIPLPEVVTPERRGRTLESLQSPWVPDENTSPVSSSTATTTRIDEDDTPRAELSHPAWPQAMGVRAVRSMRSTGPGENDTRLGDASRINNQSPESPTLAPNAQSTHACSTVRHLSLELTPAESSDVKSPAITSDSPTRLSRSPIHTEDGSSPSGCCISAPISPPAHYPTLSSPEKSRASRHPTRQVVARPVSSASSTISTSLSISLPDPPTWAIPPEPSSPVSSRGWSLSEHAARPTPQLMDGAKEDCTEIIKGSEGRIAIRSAPSSYSIMVWLPGFTIDNITIATRGSRTIHIVADQWDEADHAHWDIKLGEDADLRAVRAKFCGKELKISVGRKEVQSPSSDRRAAPITPNTSTKMTGPHIPAVVA